MELRGTRQIDTRQIGIVRDDGFQFTAIDIGNGFEIDFQRVVNDFHNHLRHNIFARRDGNDINCIADGDVKRIVNFKFSIGSRNVEILGDGVAGKLFAAAESKQNQG